MEAQSSICHVFLSLILFVYLDYTELLQFLNLVLFVFPREKPPIFGTFCEECGKSFSSPYYLKGIVTFTTCITCVTVQLLVLPKMSVFLLA